MQIVAARALISFHILLRQPTSSPAYPGAYYASDLQAVEEVFGSDVGSDFEDDEEPAAPQPSRKRAAERDPKRPPAKRKPRSRSAFGG